MKQLLAAVVAGTFAFIAAAPIIAAEKANPALAKACKDKKPGAQVIIAGKKTKCPAAKK